MPTALNFDPGTWNSTVEAPYTLGAEYETGGKTYMYVQLSSQSVAGANGMIPEQAHLTEYIVTVERATVTAPTTLGRAPMGVLVGTVTAGNFCFMQTRGLHSAVKDAANAISALDKITSHATVDGDAKAPAAYTEIFIGYATGAASGGVFTAMLGPA